MGIREEAQSYTMEAVNCILNFRNNEAIQLYKKVLKIGEDLNDTKIKSMALINIANPLISDNEFTEAIEYCKKGIALISGSNDPESLQILSRAYLFLTRAYMGINQTVEANLSIDKAIDISNQTKNLEDLSKCYVISGELKMNMGKYQQALLDYENALKYVKTTKETYMEITCNFYIGYIIVNNIRPLLNKKKELKRAINNLKIAKKLAGKLKHPAANEAQVVINHAKAMLKGA